MKRILSVILLAVLGVTLVSCGHRVTYDALPGEALAQSPFYAEASRKDDRDFALPFNAVVRLFGGSDQEHALVYRFGNEPTYFEWMALKTAWTGDAAYVRELKDKIVSFPQTDNGFIWSWSTSTYWPTGKGALHYDGLFRYVAAVSELLRWEADPAFLDETDGTTCGDDRALDASEGRTVYEKCRAAMEYAYELLDGKSGLITLTERSVFLADGTTRFDINENGEAVWDNTGRAGSASSNYWDNLCFGHTDAYETMLYYHALNAMRDIETMRGDAAAAKRYADLAALVKERFNETFWSEETGRYIACVDADGKRWDPGLTFLNTEALVYGLGDAEKAGSVFSWLDGDRKVAGDTLTGKAVMDYPRLLKAVLGRTVTREKLRFAPVTNTVSIEALSGDGAAWWFDLEGAITVGEGGNAAYGRHLENGGYIFYPVFYELTARAAYLGEDDVKRRVKELAAVYGFNGFDSDVGGWVEGLVGEFPESGIVSRAYVSSLCGILPAADALEIRPHIPSGIETLGIGRMTYGGTVFGIGVGNETLSVRADSPFPDRPIVFYPALPGAYAVRLTHADGTEESAVLRTAADGGLRLPLRSETVREIHVAPEK